MMNRPLRRVDPLGRSATPVPDRETHAPSATWIGGSVWPIRDGSMRAIVDIICRGHTESSSGVAGIS
jgi:hypothetical protein